MINSTDGSIHNTRIDEFDSARELTEFEATECNDSEISNYGQTYPQYIFKELCRSHDNDELILALEKEEGSG